MDNLNMMSAQLTLGIFLEYRGDNTLDRFALGSAQRDSCRRKFYLPGFEMFLSRNLGTLRYHQNRIYPLDN
jgi:hypothetical protein